jgi:UDP-N-acetyl-2-amino-2-deoxyglucuronate dehydrogenase
MAGYCCTQFSHFIDLLYWFFGDVKKIFSITKMRIIRTVLNLKIAVWWLLEFENGIIGTINFSVNSFGKNHEGSLMILGENGR